MKKLLLLAGALLLWGNSAFAQSDDQPFSHMSGGFGIGTTGFDFQVATNINKYLALRAGFSFLPSIKITPTIDFDDADEDFLRKEDGSGYYQEADVEAKIHIGDFKLLLDYYPFRNSSFHLTAGAFIGKTRLVTAKTTSHFLNETYWGNSGVELGDALNTYTLVSDDQGRIRADVKVNGFKPYLGIGFGYPIPKKALNVTFDFGVQFWGTPAVYTLIDDNNGKEFRKVERSRITSQQEYCDDIRDALKTIEKVGVYPTLTVRLNGRIF